MSATPLVEDYEGCRLQLTSDGRDFTCGLHDAPVLEGMRIGGGADKPACGELRQRLRVDADERIMVVKDTRLRVVQTILTKDPSEYVRCALAGSPHLTPAPQAILAEDPELVVRCALAGNRSLTPARQAILAKDPHQGVRVVLADNPNLAPAGQAILAEDPDVCVRWALARYQHVYSPNLAPAVQTILARDPEWDVRRILAHNQTLARGATVAAAGIEL